MSQLLTDVATLMAAHAHERMFSSRRGLIEIEETSFVVLYDNHPFANDADRRARLLGLVKARLADAGVAPIAESAFPLDGIDAGYTVTLLFDAKHADAIKAVIEPGVFVELFDASALPDMPS
jgi:hypothetical protein